MQQIQQTIVLLDGGLGQEISKRAKRSEPHPLWSLMVMMEEPQVVVEAHLDFIRAGARVLAVNNYTATLTRLTREALQAQFEDIHQLAVELLNQAIDESGVETSQFSRMGCLPPLAASYVADVAPSYEMAYQEYVKLITVQDGLVDGFLVETMSNNEEMRAARDALVATGHSVRIGMTLADDGSNCLRSGEPLEEAIEMLAGGALDGCMVNCSQPEVVLSALPLLASLGCPFGAYANGFTTVAPLQPGGTVKDLKERIDLTPEAYTQHALEWINAGATIVGGCCEISPRHIEYLHQTLVDQHFSIEKFNH